MAIDRRLLYNLDWGLLLAVLKVSAIGVLTILSATPTARGSGTSSGSKPGPWSRTAINMP